MAKRTKNRARTNKRTYRKKKSKISKRKRMNRKRTIKRKNIMRGGGDGIVSTIGDPQKVFIGQPQFNINGIMGFLSEFGFLGGGTLDSMMVTQTQITDLFNVASKSLKKVSGKAMGVLKSFNTHVNQETGQASQGGGGPPGLKWLLKKILGVSIGGLIKIFWYFFIQPDINKIFESINNKFIFTYNRKYSLIGITSIYDSKLKQFHLKNDDKSFPLYINLKDVIDMFLPILINYAYSIKNFQKLLDAIGIKTEEEFLIKLMGELKERDNTSGQGGGGRYLKEKYYTTKGKLVGAKDDAKKYLHTKSDQVKKFIGERMETITSFGSDMANTIVIFLIFHIIFYIYENAVNSQGRWVQFGMSNDNKFGIFIKKGELNSKAEFIALTDQFKEGNKDETIKQKIKESEDKDKELEEGSEEQAKVAAKLAAGDTDEVDAGGVASVDAGSSVGVESVDAGEGVGVAVGPQSQTPDPSLLESKNQGCEHCDNITGLFKNAKKKNCINECKSCNICDPRNAAGFQTKTKEERKKCWADRGCQGKSP
jgi:hypothetical protein